VSTESAAAPIAAETSSIDAIRFLPQGVCRTYLMQHVR
jgi:hypothetical protein